MHDRDTLHRFLFERFPIRGHLVHLDAAWRALIEHRDYPDVIRETLGEAVVASLLLAATIKFEGVLSLQLQGNDPKSVAISSFAEPYLQKSALAKLGILQRDQRAPHRRNGVVVADDELLLLGRRIGMDDGQHGAGRGDDGNRQADDEAGRACGAPDASH